MKDLTNVSISISKKLIVDIEEHVKGKSRSEKVCKCVEKGYEFLTASKPNRVGGIGFIIPQDIEHDDEIQETDEAEEKPEMKKSWLDNAIEVF